MKVSKKLQIIQEYSGMTQTRLAQQLGVTFASLNRWMNQKAEPHKKTLEKIDQLYVLYKDKNNMSQTSLKKSNIRIFEQAHQTFIKLQTLLDLLTPSELETLEILMDDETMDLLARSMQDVKEGRVVPLKSILE